MPQGHHTPCRQCQKGADSMRLMLHELALTRLTRKSVLHIAGTT